MTEQDLDNILKTIKSIPDGNDELARAVLKAAADSITLDKVKELTAKVGQEEQTKTTESMNHSEILIFSEKEILKMPKRFRQQFRYKGVTAHVHKRKSGKYNWNYEVRCQIEGIKINVSSNDYDRAKQKFIDRLDEIDKYGVVQAPSIPLPSTGLRTTTLKTFTSARLRRKRTA